MQFGDEGKCKGWLVGGIPHQGMKQMFMMMNYARIGVGICSSVIPYVSDQLAMRRLPRATYALMVSLLPATATVIGVLVLSQVPSLRETLGVTLVVLGVALHSER